MATFFISQDQYEELSRITRLTVGLSSLHDAEDTNDEPETESIGEDEPGYRYHEGYGAFYFPAVRGRSVKWDPVYAVAPFPTFQIVVNEPQKRWYDMPCADLGGLRIEDYVALLDVSADEDGFSVCRYGPEQVDYLSTEGGPQASEDAGDESSHIAHLIASGMDLHTGEFFTRIGLHESFSDSQVQNLIFEDLARNVRHVAAVAAFCLMLNQQDVLVSRIDDPRRPINRQQRRAALRAGTWRADEDCYQVQMRRPTTIRTLVSRAARGIGVLRKRPHWVRCHPRRLADGKRISVKSHVRGGTPKQKAYYNAQRLETATFGCTIDAVIVAAGVGA